MKRRTYCSIKQFYANLVSRPLPSRLFPWSTDDTLFEPLELSDQHVQQSM